MKNIADVNPCKVEIVLHEYKDLVLPFGVVGQFKVANLPPNSQYRTYLKFQAVYYPTPFQDWTYAKTFNMLPESPGEYQLFLEYRGRDIIGKTTLAFRVTSDVKNTTQPTLFKLKGRAKMWVPSTWEQHFFHSHEQTALNKLIDIIQPGWTVYDIGANIGYYAYYIAKKVGDRGHVYCFEANPLLAYFTNANFEQNRIQNASVIPLAICDSERQVDFRINYGNSLIGRGDDSAPDQLKNGLSLKVWGNSLDETVKQFGLNKPQLIKIDIEGAEELALKGMLNILRNVRPIILLEVHGGKLAQSCLTLLKDHQYVFVDAITDEAYTYEEAVNKIKRQRLGLFFCFT